MRDVFEQSPGKLVSRNVLMAFVLCAILFQSFFPAAPSDAHFKSDSLRSVRRMAGRMRLPLRLTTAIIFAAFWDAPHSAAHMF
ncbi:MAG: hypothetical protein C3F11_21075 [Methylocystaceae bacterium]|nr:MAG: hypothetical protein C3F11_21075 [Methylocystaceae bacterium]